MKACGILAAPLWIALAFSILCCSAVWGEDPIDPNVPSREITSLDLSLEGELYVGGTARILITAHRADGTTEDLTGSALVSYQTYPEEIVAIDTTTGLLTSLERGEAAVAVGYAGDGTAFNVLGVRARLPGDRDDDGLTDTYEVEHGFDPDVPGDGDLDIDHDALTAIEEAAAGTDPRNSDSDQDGASDGLEIARGTNPLVSDLVLPPKSPLNESCFVSALNRTAPVDRNGVWVLPNVPANVGQVRVRATCVENGVLRSGASSLITVPENGVIKIEEINFQGPPPVPASLALSAPLAQLTAIGQTVQISALATYPSGSTADVTAAGTGTDYRTSNPAIATVDANGLVTARASGTALVSAVNEGALALIRIQVVAAGDSDGDGLPDDWELANGLDPNNPADAIDDADGDGLSTAEEFQLSLDPANPDGDGDGLLDGEEIRTTGTNPALFDTDGDQISDGLELATGSNPLDPNSFDLSQALAFLVVRPDSATLTYNVLLGDEASLQLTVTGVLIDDTEIDLTSTARGTAYQSSDLTVCNFGPQAGEVFAGQAGTCTVTVENAGFSAEAAIDVRSLPAVLSRLQMPGHANAVDVQGEFAYVAAGAAGLQIVDVLDREAPTIVASLDTPGNANDVKVSGSLALVADGSAGLIVVDIGEPFNPRILGSLDTPGTALDVALRGETAFVADGSGGLRIVDLSNPRSPVLLGSLPISGSAEGVEIDEQGTLAVVATSSGIRTVNVTNRAAPQLLGSATTGQARDVVLSQGFAFVADRQNSLTAVDVRDPAHPSVRSSTPQNTGGLLNDVALAGRFAFGADIFFVNGVPIFDVSVPQAPVPRAILDFRSFSDDNGTGIAVDPFFVYLTGSQGLGDNGDVGQTSLYIGQYLSRVDTDEDGLPDDYELAHGFDPQNPNDGAEDPDNDGLTNLDEFFAHTDPRRADMDGDGLLDGDELSRGTDPRRPDTDRDGLSDSAEVSLGTDPRKADTDGDGLPDGQEVALGSNPLRSDTDGDGLTDSDEVARGTSPTNVDTDGDGARDGFEVALACDPLRSDLTDIAGRALRSEGVPFEGARAEVLGRPGQIDLSDANGLFSLTGILACPPSLRVAASAREGNVRLRGLSATLAATLSGVTDVGDILLAPVERPLYPLPETTSGLTPHAIATGDFNQDGVVDLVVANRDPDQLAVFLGNGNGTFQPRVLYGVGIDPVDVAVADLDRDGRQDLISANFGTSGNDFVSVLLGNGDGSFRRETRFEVGNGPLGIAVADLGTDGIPDVVTTSSFGFSVVILTGRGDGTFSSRTQLSVGSSPGDVAVADLLGDGINDIITTNFGSDDVSVLQRSSGAPVHRRFPVGGDGPQALALGDFNRDGRLDIATANSNTNDASILLADGSGGFQTARRVPVGSRPSSVAAGDFDGDGDADLAVTNQNQDDVSVLLSNGDGTFRSAVSFSTGDFPLAVALADLEGDGVLDMVTANFASQDVGVLFGEGDGTFWTRRIVPTGGNHPLSLAVTDLNGDGKMDIVAPNLLSNDVSVFLQGAGGALQALPRFATGPSPASIVAPDLDGDGIPDLAMITDGFSLHLGNGDGTFQPEQSHSAPGVWNSIATADFNRDGNADLFAVRSDPDGVSVFLGNGDGTLQVERRLPAGETPVFTTAADVNGDGSFDVLAVNANSEDVAVLLGNGDGTFAAPQFLAVDHNPRWVAAGDLDGDGDVDLAVANELSLSIFLGNGNGTFQPERRIVRNRSSGDVRIRDLNADGKPDLMLSGMAVLLGNGDGTFQPEQRFGGIPVHAIEDINGDGQPDALGVVDSQNAIWILLHR